jgi:hypothetical protein
MICGKNCQLSRPVVEFSKVFWPSLNCSYDELEHWKTEWERHGRCSDLSQLDWFKLGIKLFESDFIVGFNAEGTTFPPVTKTSVEASLIPFLLGP